MLFKGWTLGSMKDQLASGRREGRNTNTPKTRGYKCQTFGKSKRSSKRSLTSI